MLAPAPLVYLECDLECDAEQLAEEGEHRSATEERHRSSTRYVMLHREKFDAVCQNGNAAFVALPSVETKACAAGQASIAAAQAADSPGLAGAWGSLGHALAPLRALQRAHS